MPRQIDSVPSVVTNGESLILAISSPLNNPIRAAIASPPPTAASITAYGTAASAVAESRFMKMAVITATSPMTEPTDRSMPPVMITSVEPSETMPI